MTRLRIAFAHFLDVRAARRISQHRVDEARNLALVAFDVDFQRAVIGVPHRALHGKTRRDLHDAIAKPNALHPAVQLDDDALYAFTSARAAFAALASMPLSPM